MKADQLKAAGREILVSATTTKRVQLTVKRARPIESDAQY